MGLAPTFCTWGTWMGMGKDVPPDSRGPGSPDSQSPTNALLPEGPPCREHRTNNNKDNTLPPGLMNVAARKEKLG